MEEVGELNYRAFWYFVNKKKYKKKKKTRLVRDDSGRIIRDDEEAIGEWKGYCERLFSPQSNASYDQAHKAWIEMQINDGRRSI